MTNNKLNKQSNEAAAKTKKSILCYAVVFVVLFAFFLRFMQSSDQFSLTKNYPDSSERQLDTLVLEEGEYQVDVEYESASDGSISLYSGKSVQSDNTSGKTYGYANLNADSTNATFTIDVDKYTSDLGIYIDGNDTTVSSITVSSTSNSFYKDHLLLPIVFLILLIIAEWSVYLLIKHKKLNESNKTRTFLVLIGLIVIVSFPVLASSLHNTPYQDLVYHLNRIKGFSEAIGNTSFPIRIHPNEFGYYGQAMSTFYPELFLFPSALLCKLGMSLLNSYRVLELLINLTTVIIGYVSFKAIFKKPNIAIVLTTLYALSIYRLSAMYVRSALGESLAMIFLPLLVLGLYKVFFENHKQWWILSIAITGIMQSHLITTELSAVICVLLGLIYLPKLIKEKRILSVVKAIGFFIGLNIWWLIPFIDFSAFGVGALVRDTGVQEPIVNNLLSFIAITYPLQAAGDMPFSMGLLLFIGLLAYVFAQFNSEFRKQSYNKLGLLCVILSFVLLWMASAYFPWNNSLSILKKIGGTLQFSWRTLSMVTILSVVAVGILLANLKMDKNKYICLGTLIVSICLSSVIIVGYFKQIPVYADKNYIADIDDDGYTLDGWYLPIGTEIYYLYYEPGTVKTSADTQITDLYRNGSILSYNFVSSNEDVTHELPILAYPGYKVYLNGVLTTSVISNNKLITIDTGETISGTVSVEYQEKLVYYIGDVISIASIIGMVVIIVKGRKNEKYA